ncbi:MAG: helix-turn-helix transcriptional regulator [Oscillochloris sp.]|nr:helix-turn-helix transcriptional regulator [Oscillochloris sp.]
MALSKRQIEVLQLVAEGYTYPEIGERLHLSRPTVRHHMREIISQLHLKSLAEIVAPARQSCNQASSDESFTCSRTMSRLWGATRTI